MDNHPKALQDNQRKYITIFKKMVEIQTNMCYIKTAE
jgi:hypothetical protein